MNKKNPLITFICFIVIAMIFASAFIPFPIINGSKQVPGWYFIGSIILALIISFKLSKNKKMSSKYYPQIKNENIYNSITKKKLDSKNSKSSNLENNTMKNPNILINENPSDFTFYPYVPETHTKQEKTTKVKSKKQSTFNEEFSDYQTTVFLYALQRKTAIKKENYPKHILYNLGIENLEEFQESLYTQGYLTHPNTESILNTFKVSDLKILCDQLGLLKQGNKSDIIKCIIEGTNNEVLDNIIESASFFKISEKGVEYIKNHYDYILLHNHSQWKITLEKYIEMKKVLPFKGSFNDIAWAIFIEREGYYILNNSYSLLRNNYLYMGDLLKEENKNEQSLYYFARVLFFDLSGHDIIEYFKNLLESNESDLNSYLDDHKSPIAILPAILDKIHDLKVYYSDILVDEMYSNIHLPYNCCSKKIYKMIIHDLFSDTLNIEFYEKLLFMNLVNIVKNIE